MQGNTKNKWMALGLLGFGLLVALQYSGLMLFSARQLDEQALEQSTARVNAMLKRAQDVQIAVSQEYGWWDDLIFALERVDQNWLAEEFDASIEARYGVTHVVALDEDYVPIFFTGLGERISNSALNGWSLELLQPIIDRTHRSSMDFPESAVTILKKDGEVYIVTAAALTPISVEAQRASGSKRKTLLLMAPMDDDYLRERSGDLQIHNLRWSSVGGKNTGTLQVNSAEGDPQGYLSWNIERPSGVLLATITLWSIPIGVLSVGFALLLIRWFGGLIERSKQSEIRSAALQQSKAYFQSLSDNAPVLIWQADLSGNIIYANQVFYRLWDDLLPGRRPRDMSALHVDSGEEGLADFLERVMRSEGSVQQDCVLRVDGETKRWLSVSGLLQPHSGQDADSFLFSATDVTARKETEQLIWKQANFDALTGLANRSLLIDRLEQELASALRSNTEGGVMFIDLDNFKAINDSLGHSAGDEVLRQVARRVAACLRSRDTLARFGGDEFVALLPGTAERSKVSEVAQRIRTALKEPVLLGDQNPSITKEVLVTASIGVAYYPADGDDRDGLLNSADKAMYLAKQQGRDSIVFHGSA